MTNEVKIDTVGGIDSVAQATSSHLLSSAKYSGEASLNKRETEKRFFVLPAAQQTLCVCVRIASECNRTRNEPFLLHIPEEACDVTFPPLLSTFLVPAIIFLAPFLSFAVIEHRSILTFVAEESIESCGNFFVKINSLSFKIECEIVIHASKKIRKESMNSGRRMNFFGIISRKMDGWIDF